MEQPDPLGGVGFISAVSNLAPWAVSRMFEAWDAGDHDTARELHYALHPLVDLLFVETNPAPLKWVLHQQHRLASPYVRPPLIPSPAARSLGYAPCSTRAPPFSTRP
ncbi:dihydrodipicolinate synthase family protein [Mycolicibacterium smegmatis]|uniref:4-hydroxy-tetrahydrodipicolinate synthase n=1 Tax=Mycolicibacterium smegmatis (strain MKD8) TaxID=1214915 RepID=A0A2U9Q0L6_MYCSE|nr:dihydrodipicolinate synthase family protein [Mycolicibacterium smegmatis]AWT57609.1 4-hydroxy-tetrahydrodipicolinate synthase [Mycolicibacterium smegmatis MKD8]